jgi:hypothetical protein
LILSGPYRLLRHPVDAGISACTSGWPCSRQNGWRPSALPSLSSHNGAKSGWKRQSC